MGRPPISGGGGGHKKNLFLISLLFQHWTTTRDTRAPLFPLKKGKKHKVAHTTFPQKKRGGAKIRPNPPFFPVFSFFLFSLSSFLLQCKGASWPRGKEEKNFKSWNFSKSTHTSVRRMTPMYFQDFANISMTSRCCCNKHAWKYLSAFSTILSPVLFFLSVRGSGRYWKGGGGGGVGGGRGTPSPFSISWAKAKGAFYYSPSSSLLRSRKKDHRCALRGGGEEVRRDYTFTWHKKVPFLPGKTSLFCSPVPSFSRPKDFVSVDR